MPKEIIFFYQNNFSLKNNFFKLMNILITNQSSSLLEALIIGVIYYIQIISSFFAKQIGVFNPDKFTTDYTLYKIESILRIKDLFIQNYSGLEILNSLILAFLVVFIFYFFVIVYRINMSYYKFKINIINFLIKLFLFFLYNICLDISFSQMCFGKKHINPGFEGEIECFGNNKLMIIIPTLTIIFAIIIHQIFRLYYFESFFITEFFFAKVNSYYDVFMDINLFINSILLTQAPFFNKKFFLYYNLIFSIFIFVYYIKNYIYYNTYIHLTSGIFHIIYAWTSLFSIFATYINFNEKAVVYIISSIFVGFIFYHMKNKYEKNIFYQKSINKISNSNYLLAYIKALTDLLLKCDKNDKEIKGIIGGVLKQLIRESPNNVCDGLMKEKMYIPLTNTWRDLKKENVTDNVFIKYFIVILYHYFLVSKDVCPELFMNLSHYYLVIIGNHCEAMYYCQKLFQYDLNAQQKFSFYRLQDLITHSLTKKLKSFEDKNISLENINISSYYEYENLCENFLEKINTDIDLSLKFWKLFREMYKNPEYKLNFNEVFELSEKIQLKKKNIDKIWKDMMIVYSGINEFFELYTEYIIQINDDDIKKRELDAFKKKILNQEDDYNNNFYSILFNKETGIIIVEKDKGIEGVIKHWNKRIEKIFKYTEQELKEKRINLLMPKNIEHKHSMFMENYFRSGYNKYVETKDFKTFAKDKNNSIFQIRLAIKLLPVLNHNVMFTGLIVKENINDVILVDEKFNIQGICEKLKNNLKISNNSLFQYNDIPFYIICKKFINFYKMFLWDKRKENNDDGQINEIAKKKTNSTTDKQTEKVNASSKRKGEKEEDVTKKDKDEGILNKQNQENLEINENFELEFEIKFPQFLINYSNRTKFNKRNYFEKRKLNREEFLDKEDEELDEEDNELLLSNYSKKKIQKKNSIITSTPYTFSETQTFPINLTFLNVQPEPFERPILNKSEEEKIFLEKLDQLCTLFKEENFQNLEDLIDSCNKDSKYVEYKFNFTFDKYKFGEKEIAYIIRCIDDKNNEGHSEEKSFEQDSNMINYKKNKEQSIKPLYEITKEEREETIKSPEKFFKLLDNPNFREVLNKCKEEINKMSKIKGNTEDNLLETDNSSQSFSHSGFDNDLIIKNKISEIRSNLYQNTKNYFTIKYIRLVIICISLTTFIFSLTFILFIHSLFITLKGVSIMNLNLFKVTLKTIDLIGIIISLKALILIKSGKKNFLYNNYISEEIKTNEDYYIKMINIGSKLYNELNNEYGNLNIFITKYISEENLLNIYWDHINISYLNELYIRNNKKGKESFPTAVNQFLINTIIFLKKYNYSIADFSFTKREDEEYFNYITFLLIENPYINLIPNLFIKLEKIPELYSLYNNSQKKYIYLIIFIYFSFQVFICITYITLIRITNSSMSDIFKKLTKIKFEKIEETIKRIQKFLSHLKSFREILGLNIDEEEDEIKDNKEMRQRRRNSMMPRHSVHFNLVPKGEISYISNNGFNSDIRKYYPLTISRHYFVHSVIFSCILFAFIIPLYIYSINVINVINQLLLIINYIYGKLMNTSLSIVDLKCYIMECKLGVNTLSYEKFSSNENIQLFVKGLRNFHIIEDFYDNKFMLNACDAAIDKTNDSGRYNICISDGVVISANNTDNIMQLITNFIDNIYHRDRLERMKNKSYNNNNNIRQMMFNDSIYQEIEYLFFNYVFTVEDIFENTVKESLDRYIKRNKFFLVILILIFCIIMIIYNISYIIFLTPKLKYLINISRGIIKIIPTSVIMNTPELQTLIGTKY